MRVTVVMSVEVPDYDWKNAHKNISKGSLMKPTVAEDRTRTFHIVNEVRRALGSTHPFWNKSLNGFNLTWAADDGSSGPKTRVV